MPPMSLGMNARRVVVVCVLAAALAACSVRPYKVSTPKSLAPALILERKAASAAGRPAPRLLSLCYGRVLNTAEEVLEEARYQCRGEVRYWDKDLLWTPCGLLQPVRASFICTPGSKGK